MISYANFMYLYYNVHYDTQETTCRTFITLYLFNILTQASYDCNLKRDTAFRYVE